MSGLILDLPTSIKWAQQENGIILSYISVTYLGHQSFSKVLENYKGSPGNCSVSNGMNPDSRCLMHHTKSPKHL